MIRLALCLSLCAGAAQADAERVLSIGGSVTEIVYALGQGDRLVGRDTTSTFPEAAQALPDVGYMRALSPEGVLSVGPDLILTEAGAGPAETLATLRATGLPITEINEVFTPDGVLTRVREVAAALQVPEAGERLAARLDAEMQAALAEIPGAGPRPRVLFILANTGGRLMGAGSDNAADAMIALAGGQNALTGFSGYKALTDEAIAGAAPNVIVVMDRAAPQTDDTPYLTHPALAQTPAGRAKRVVHMPGMFLLGFGPRTPEAIRALHAALYPEG